MTIESKSSTDNYRSLYQEKASQYQNRFTGKKGTFLQYEKEVILDILEPKYEERILDVGTGTGFYARSLSRLGCLVTGIDISENMIEIAKAQDNASQYIAVSLKEYLSSEPFDRILGVGMLEYLGKEDFFKLSKIVKRRGVIVLSGVFNHYSPWSIIYRLFRDKRIPYKTFTKRKLGAIGCEAGLELISFASYFILPLKLSSLIPFWNADMDRVLSRTSFFRYRGYVICAGFRKL